jgi:YD repeat-containing protein
MRKSPLWLFCLFLAIAIHNSNAQSPAPTQPPNVFPVSPEVATLGKFIDTPVGTYSGVPDISVPLYEVKYKSISIPLTLSYHANGVKVSDDASWVGLNWDLFSGGFISQSRVGRKTRWEDEDITIIPGWSDFIQSFNNSSNYFPGYQFLITKNESAFGVGWECSNPNFEAEVINLMKRKGCSQPDIYSYSFLAHSGKFATDLGSLEPLILKKTEEIKFERTSYNGPWKATTIDGNEFYFELMGNASDHYTEIVSTNTWKLTRIKSKDGGEITFEYLPYNNQVDYLSEYYKSEDRAIEPNNDMDPRHRFMPSSTHIQDYYLTKINTPTEIIEFILEERADLQGSTRRVKEVIVKDALSLLPKRSFEFSYGYFDCDNSTSTYWAPVEGGDYLCKRLKLNGVKEVGYDNLGGKVYYPGKGYSFEYNEDVKLPSKTSFAKDYWGYYNGEKTNTTSLPDLVPIYLPYEDFRYTLSQLYYYKNIPFSLLRSAYRANRAPNKKYMQAAILKKINVPTGGSKVYTFEPHTFTNVSVLDVDQVKTLPVQYWASDRNVANDPYPWRTEIATPCREMYLNFQISFNAGIQNLTFEQMLQSEVRLVKQVGQTVSTLRSWKMTNNIEDRTKYNQDRGYYLNEDFLVNPEAGANYFIEAYFPDDLPPQGTNSSNTAAVGCTVKYYNFTPAANPSYYGGGLRISRIELRDESDKVVYTKRYDYDLNGQTTGIVLSPPKYLTFQHLVFKKLLPYCGNSLGSSPSFSIETQEQDVYTVSNESNVSLSLSPNAGFIGYGTVTEIEESSTTAGVVNSKTRYNFKNQVNAYKEDFPEDPWLDNGQLLKKSYLTNDVNPVTVKEEIYSYDCPSSFDKMIIGYLMDDGYRGPDECLAYCDQTAIYNPYVYGGRFKLKSYPIRSKFYQMTSKVVNDYSGSGKLTSTTTYTYNGLGLLASETHQTSTGDVKQKQFYYPYDSPSDFTFTARDNMKTDFYNPVILEKDFYNATLQRRVEYQYRKYDSPMRMYVPSYITEKNAQNGAIKFLDIPSYSIAQGNPNQFKGNDDINTVILWGLNATVPVAKIEGATLSEVNSALGVSSTSLENFSIASLKTTLLNLYSLSKARVGLFIYNDKSQLIETMDPNKVSTYYEYDEFGRLKDAKDRDNNIVKAYDYWYLIK